MTDKLSAWVTEAVKERGWSLRELARQGDISHTLVSRTLAGKMPASADFCIKVAVALDEPPEKILRLAGILPEQSTAAESDLGPITNEILQLIHDMSPEDKRQVLDYIRFLRRDD